MISCRLWVIAEAVTAILASEAFAVNRELFAAHPEAVAEPAASILGFGSTFTPEQVEAARAVQKAWKDELAGVFERVEAIALPTLLCFPPPVDGSEGLDTVIRLVAATAALNLAGVPCVCLPIPAPGGPGLPASLQLVGPEGSEERLLPLAARVEAAVGP